MVTSANAAKNTRVIIEDKPEIISRNEVKITGPVIYLYQIEGKDIVIMTIAAAGTGGTVVNYPKVVWYGDEARRVAAEVKPGAKRKPRVAVTGYVQTSKSVRGGKTEHYQNIVGKSMAFAPTHLEAVMGEGAGGRAVKTENEVVIAGELIHKFNFSKKGSSSPLGTVVTVRTSDRIPNYPKVTLFREQSAAVQKMPEGCNVAVVATVHTNKAADSRGKAVYHETLVGLDIGLCERAFA